MELINQTQTRMDFKKSKKIINKLNTLMDSFESLGDDLTDIEIALLERYIDDLKASLPRRNSTDHINEAPKKLVLKKEEDVEVQKEAPEPIVEEKLEPIQETIENKVQETEDVQPQESAEPAEVNGVNLDSLFTKLEVKELSEKLSLRSIEDIGKALSINERILTQNDLFNGDKSLMSETLSKLNNMDNYEQAILFLKNGVAKSCEWASDDKKGKATHFLKLVQRRYA